MLPGTLFLFLLTLFTGETTKNSIREKHPKQKNLKTKPKSHAHPKNPAIKK